MMHGCISVFVVVDIINDNTVSPSPLERGLGGEARNDIHINHVHNNSTKLICKNMDCVLRNL